MRVIYTLFMFLLSGSLLAQQQAKIRPLLAVYTDLPTGMFASVYTLNMGVSAGGELEVSSKFDLTASAGYSRFERHGNFKALSMLTLLAGGRYHMSQNAFMGGRAGLAWPVWDHGVPVFSIVPSAGVTLSKHFDLQVNYHAYVLYGFLMGSAGLELTFYPGNRKE